MSGSGEDYVNVDAELARATSRAFANLHIDTDAAALAVDEDDTAGGGTIPPSFTPSGRISVASSVTGGGGLLETFRTPQVSNRTPPLLSTSRGSMVSSRRRLSPADVGTSSVPPSVVGGVGRTNFFGRVGAVTGKVKRCMPIWSHEGVKGEKCLGVLKGGQRMCLGQCIKNKNHCGIEKHADTKFEPEFAKAYYPPAKNVSDKRTAFIYPHIDAEEILPEFLKTFDSGLKKTDEWVSYILEAKEAFARTNLAPPIAEVAESESEDEAESGDEDSLATNPGPSTLPVSGRDYGLEEDSVVRNIVREDFVPAAVVNVPIPPYVYSEELDDEIAEQRPVQETRIALDAVMSSMYKLSKAIPEMGSDVAEHFTPHINSVIQHMNDVSIKVRTLENVLGDASKMVELVEVNNVAESVVVAFEELLNATEQLKSQEARLSSVEAANSTLKNDIHASFNAQLIKSHSGVVEEVAKQLQAIISRVFKLEKGAAPSASPPSAAVSHTLSPSKPVTIAIPHLTMNMKIVDDHGVEQMTLGALMNGFADLKSEVARLGAAVVAQGGIKVGEVVYSSEDELRVHVMDLTNTMACAAFVDCVSLVAHDKIDYPVSDPSYKSDIKNLVAQGISHPSDQRYLSTFSRPYPPGYTKGDDAEVGRTLTCFKKEQLWDGTGGLDGFKAKIGQSLKRASQAAKVYIKANIPPSSPLYELAMDMVTRSMDFHSTFHTHVDNEKAKLQQMGIDAAEVMLLISEQFILIFNDFYTVRQNLFDFVDGMDAVDHLTRVIWVTCKAHMAMDSYLVNGLMFHQIIASSFVRFLTRQLGQQSQAKIESLIRQVATIKTDASEGKKVANAQKVRLDNLFTANSTLKTR